MAPTGGVEPPSSSFAGRSPQSLGVGMAPSGRVELPQASFEDSPPGPLAKAFGGARGNRTLVFRVNQLRDTTVPSYRLGPALLAVSPCCHLEYQVITCLSSCQPTLLLPGCIGQAPLLLFREHSALSQRRPFRRRRERHRPGWPQPQQRDRNRRFLFVKRFTSLSTKTGRT